MAGQNLDNSDRVTITLAAHHQHVNTDPVSCNGKYSRFLDGIEDPYTRNIKVTPQGINLDVGWIENPAYLYIENRSGLNRSVNPTPEEKEEDAAQIIHLYTDENCQNPVVIRSSGGFVFLELIDPRMCVLKSMSKKDIPATIKVFCR